MFRLVKLNDYEFGMLFFELWTFQFGLELKSIVGFDPI